MRRALFLLAVLLALSVFTTPSRAQFIECTQDYIDGFQIPVEGTDPSWSAGQADCHEFFRYSFATPAGTRWIRLIGDANAARFLPPGGLEAIEEGARRATRLMPQLGSYLVDDITMLAAQPRSSPASPQQRGGYDDAWTVSGEGPEFRSCEITLLITLNHAAVDIHQTVGHEIFHCIQAASLPADISDTSLDAGMWWSEGSAELFGVAAARSAGGRYNQAAMFEQSVANREPLHRMTYQAVIFFYWLVQEDGMDGLLPFLRRMAREDGEPAQVRAMTAAKSATFWSEFAQAYDDRAIRGPGDISLSFGQRIDGEAWFVAGSTDRHQRALSPFTIELGWITYECGVWENTISQDIEVRREDQTSWASLPERVDTDNRGDIRYRLATIVGDGPVDYTVASNKAEACSECNVSRAVDSCVVGRWRLTGGGPMEWMRARLAAQGVPMPRANQSDFRMTFNDDGTYTSDPFSFDFRTEYPSERRPMAGEGTGDVQGTTGRWAAQDGRFYGCVDGGGQAVGTRTLEGRGRRSTSGYSTPGQMGGGASTYTCNDTTLYTEAQMPDGDLMTHTFTRETPPPRRR